MKCNDPKTRLIDVFPFAQHSFRPLSLNKVHLSRTLLCSCDPAYCNAPKRIYQFATLEVCSSHTEGLFTQSSSIVLSAKRTKTNEKKKLTQNDILLVSEVAGEWMLCFGGPWLIPCDCLLFDRQVWALWVYGVHSQCILFPWPPMAVWMPHTSSHIKVYFSRIKRIDVCGHCLAVCYRSTKQ